jgi:FAD synthase
MENKKRNTLTIRVPRELKERIEEFSALQGVSINQFALYAFTKELGELETKRYFSEILKDTNKQDILSGFDAVMAKVPERSVPDWDKIR